MICGVVGMSLDGLQRKKHDFFGFFRFFSVFFGFFGFFYKKLSCIVILRKELFTCIYIYLIYTAGCPEYQGYFFFSGVPPVAECGR